MPVISVRVTEDGFHVPYDLAQELGLRPGEEARLEVRRAPDALAIRNAALRYVWRRLGDAVGVEEPYWDGEFWNVPLVVRGHAGSPGRLLLTEQGEISAERSTTKAEILEALDAARPHSTAAG
jgi:hypothetical protein